MPQKILGGIALLAALIVLGGCESVQSRHQVNVDWRGDQSAVKSIGVLEFEWKTPDVKVPEGTSIMHTPDAGAVVSDMVASELMKLGRYTLRERSDLKRILEEHALQLSDVVAKGDYALIGRLAGVDAVVVGRVALASVAAMPPFTRVESSFTCRCVNTRTGDILWSMGGDKSVVWTPNIGPYWIRLLTEELVKELGDKLDHPPSARQGSQ